MAVKGFRLLTGDILAASVLAEGDCSIEIANVAVLGQTRLENGSTGVAMRHYLPFSVGVQRLMKTAICSIVDLNEEFAKEYEIFVKNSLAV